MADETPVNQITLVDDKKLVRLTQTVQKGGCAAKLPARELRGALTQLEVELRRGRPKQLLVGTENMDDACVWDLDDGQLLLQTLDFFTPIVDDPYQFGQIAAANALSDVYAMGGTPRICLGILAFPTLTLPSSVLERIMAGALERIHEASACLAGGHTIDDETLKFGLSVSGFVDKHNLWTNNGALADDQLLLTKALGTGTITSALKSSRLAPEHLNEATHSMIQLNQVRDLLGSISVHSATDVTGFGLAGHALQMARASGTCFDININSLPCLPGAIEYLSQGVLNKAHRSNWDYVRPECECLDLSEPLRWLCMDPQTSGGLLLSVAAADAPTARERLSARFPYTKIIGQVRPGSGDGARLRLLG